MKSSEQAAYYITDGDIPCTPEIEPNFHYTYNLCGDVSKTSIPQECVTLGRKGTVLQSAYYDAQHYDCYVIGRYDPTQDDLLFKVYDDKDPSKGVSMTYPAGDKCASFGTQRQATIDILCADTPVAVISAEEPSLCDYHLVMKSYYGCPTVCSLPLLVLGHTLTGCVRVARSPAKDCATVTVTARTTRSSSKLIASVTRVFMVTTVRRERLLRLRIRMTAFRSSSVC